MSKMKIYVVCIDEYYVRDTQVFDTGDFTKEELDETVEIYSNEYSSCWKDCREEIFVSVVEALNEYDACVRVNAMHPYDINSLVAHSIDSFIGEQKCFENNRGGMSNVKCIPEGQDAVFLHGKIHNSEDQLYILSFNPNACDGNGSWDIEVIDRDGVLELIEEVGDDCGEFFQYLPDQYQGRWYYCDYGMPDFEFYCQCYERADFLVGRSGDIDDEYQFIKAWANNETLL